jgi:hypothetical protein
MSTLATKKESNLEDLEFLKIRIPENVRLIPQDVIEAVKGRLFTPEQFYKYQEEQMRNENPSNLLYAIIGLDKQVEGYLWAEVSQLDGSLFINTFSISEKYWHKGKVMQKIMTLLNKLKSKLGSPRVFWITTNDKFFVKHGFKRSKNVLMEYNSN